MQPGIQDAPVASVVDNLIVAHAGHATHAEVFAEYAIAVSVGALVAGLYYRFLRRKKRTR